jgi:hypothetical protein
MMGKRVFAMARRTILELPEQAIDAGQRVVNSEGPPSRAMGLGTKQSGLDIMSTEQTLLRGSCLCGLVAYEVPDSFEYSLYCHCSKCRRATGAAAKPFAAIKSDRLRFASGGDHVMRFGGGTNHDAHCERCGSLLYSLVRNGTYLHVTLGTLIDSPSIRPTAHIFVGSKAPWDDICDGLPQFDGLP